MKYKSKVFVTIVLVTLFLQGSALCPSETEPQKLKLKLLFEKTSDRTEGCLSAPRDFTMDIEKSFIFSII